MEFVKFTKERYDYIDSLVMKYQAGDIEGAGSTLIAMFEPFIKKYIDLIKKGIIRFVDYDSRKFICLFIADEYTRKKFSRNVHPGEVRAAARKMVSWINFACSHISEEDLYNEFSYIILKLAKRYKPNKGFTAYVLGSFRYEVAHMLRKEMRNPLSSSFAIETVYNLEDENSRQEFEKKEDSIIYGRSLPADEEDELNNNWIFGLCGSDIFKDLTPLERLILKMHYIDKKTDAEIGEKIGYHRNYVGEKRRKAIKALQKKAEAESITRS